jgi:hypothetical protein
MLIVFTYFKHINSILTFWKKSPKPLKEPTSCGLFGAIINPSYFLFHLVCSNCICLL